ncbi:LytR/AlgR family response regulator transcription factor [Tenacibaculum sp. UWU-22]|uniref:LytR/AlgR family response regulator transcription factor n=1 Tax=Tenacibaculum sp. UWU-22 TaxID=3234187 RepID=UPI0034DAE37C
MQTLNILLLEDNKEDAQKVQEALKDDYSVFISYDVKSAKEMISEIIFDVAIIDISLEEKTSGIEFAKFLDKNKLSFPFIFLTAMHGRAIFEKAKLTNPYTYLLKPFNNFELQYTIELIIKKYHHQEDAFLPKKSEAILNTNYFFVKNQSRILKINIDDIEYFSVDDIYSTIQTNSKKHLIRLSLKKIKEILNSKDFEHIHRKYLVNSNKIKEFNLTENTLYLESGKQLPISDRYKRALSNWRHILK